MRLRRQQAVIGFEHFRVDCLIHTLHHARRYPLAIVAGSDADELPSCALTGSLYVGMLEGRHAEDEAHTQMPPDSVDECHSGVRQIGAAMFWRDHTQTCINRFSREIELA